MGRLVRRYIRAYELDVEEGGLGLKYSDSVYWDISIASDGAVKFDGVGGTDDDFEIETASGAIILDSANVIELEPTIDDSLQYGVHINPSTIDGEYETALRIEGSIEGVTESRHGAGIKMTLERPSGSPMSSWSGSPDTAMMIDLDEEADNGAANGAARGLQIDLDNYSVINWVKGLDVGVTNRSGATAEEVWGAQIVCEAYGTLNDLMVGLDIVLLDEVTKPTEEYGIRIRNNNASIAQSADAAVKVERGNTTNTGFAYIIDAMHTTRHPISTAFARLSDDGTICADTGDKTAGGVSGWITVIIGTATRYIQLYA
jgi:hypothetical protein